MTNYNVFVPGYLGANTITPANEPGSGGILPVTGTLFQDVNAASAAAAQAAVLVAIPQGRADQCHTWLTSNDTAG